MGGVGFGWVCMDKSKTMIMSNWGITIYIRLCHFILLMKYKLIHNMCNVMSRISAALSRLPFYFSVWFIWSCFLSNIYEVHLIYVYYYYFYFYKIRNHIDFPTFDRFLTFNHTANGIPLLFSVKFAEYQQRNEITKLSCPSRTKANPIA